MASFSSWLVVVGLALGAGLMAGEGVGGDRPALLLAAGTVGLLLLTFPLLEVAFLLALGAAVGGVLLGKLGLVLDAFVVAVVVTHSRLLAVGRITSCFPPH
jgi:hypothetical protein